MRPSGGWRLRRGLDALSSGRLCRCPRRLQRWLVGTHRRRQALRRGGLPLDWRGWPDLHGGRAGVQVCPRRHKKGVGSGGIAPSGGVVARVWRMRRQNRIGGGGGGNGVGRGRWGAGGRVHRRNCSGSRVGVEELAVERARRA
jgi:hypothetical protein